MEEINKEEQIVVSTQENETTNQNNDNQNIESGDTKKPPFKKEKLNQKFQKKILLIKQKERVG